LPLHTTHSPRSGPANQASIRLFGTGWSGNSDIAEQPGTRGGPLSALAITCDRVFLERCTIGLVYRTLGRHYASCRAAGDSFGTNVLGNDRFLIAARDHLHPILPDKWASTAIGIFALLIPEIDR
jgi:hypothetical protein